MTKTSLGWAAALILLAACGGGSATGLQQQEDAAAGSDSTGGTPTPILSGSSGSSGGSGSSTGAGSGPSSGSGAGPVTDSGGQVAPDDGGVLVSQDTGTGQRGPTEGGVNPVGPTDSGVRVDSGPVPMGDGGVGWDQVPAILARIVPPTFPNLDCDITKYGGVGDGVFDNTMAFSNAIADCVSKGGGRVVAPLGAGPTTTYFTGPLELKSNINLYVPAGVTIQFTTDTTKYTPNVKVSFEGSLLYNYHPLVWAHDAMNVAITGGGTLDGNATTADWYLWLPGSDPIAAADSIALRSQNAMAVPIMLRQYGAGHHMRPSLIEFMNVQNILFDGFTAQRSPFWTIHPVMSHNITARNLHSLGNQPNTDGFDPESCTDVLIDHITIQVGDDPIAIKAGRDLDGRTFYTPTENIVIQNSTFNSGNPTHGASIAIGSEMSAGVRNVYAQDITFTSVGGVLAQAIYLKASVYRGGFIENFYARRLTVDSISTFFFLNGQYAGGAVPANAPMLFTTFNNINVDTATVNSATSEAFRITGPDATKLATNVHISNVTIKQTGAALTHPAHYSGLSMTNVSVNGAAFTPPTSAP